MAWSDPDATLVTGELITAAIWNQDVRDNTKYLKGQAGDVSMEAGHIPDTDIAYDLGSAAKRYLSIYARNLFGGRYAANPNIREVRLAWENDAFANMQVSSATAGAGAPTVLPGGTGQVALKVDDDAGGVASSRIYQQTEQNNSLDNAWTVLYTPYIRVEFSLNAFDADGELFIGFRATPGVLPPAAGEIHAGLVITSVLGDWVLSSSDGATLDRTAITTDPTAGARNVVEIYVNAATSVELWMNGIKDTTNTTKLPTGTMEWEVLLGTGGAGGATDSILTVGEIVIQEELA